MIAGGGTGGHLFPGVAIAEELRARTPDAPVRFVGTARGIEARVLPIPTEPTTEHLASVVGASRDGNWLFGGWLFNSLAVSLATAAVGVLIAIPAAYALARFRFPGKEGGVRALLDRGDRYPRHDRAATVGDDPVDLSCRLRKR